MQPRRPKFVFFKILGGLFLLALLTVACGAPAAMPTQPPAEAPSATQVIKTIEVEKEVAKATEQPGPTSQVAEPTLSGAVAPSPSQLPPSTAAGGAPSPIAQASPLPTLPAAPTPTISQEEHIVQVEWPQRLRMGDSDVVRLALIPAEEGYTLVTEFPEHQVITQTVNVPRPGGYDLYAIARLHGVGFEISPSYEQAQYLPPGGDTHTWRWTLTPKNAGQQRLSISLALGWVPVAGQNEQAREIPLYSRSLDIQVTTFLGLTQLQTLVTGVISLFLGGGLGVFALVARPPGRKSPLRVLASNPKLAIELPGELKLTIQERGLLQSLFGRYARLVIEQEFLSGYSGARAFLALPIRPDGRADAYTIAKLGELESIRSEFTNYESYVKDTLPPITARIQHAPVTAPVPARFSGARQAALQYTFIGEPGSTPTSLRQALIKDPDPRLLHKLFETFGPNWWLQRRPYTFRLAQEYDRLLPTHLVLEPTPGQRPGGVIDLRSSPASLKAQNGDFLTIRGVTRTERRADGRSLSLAGEPAAPGQPSLRLRWLSLERPEGAVGRVVATRRTLLGNLVQGCDLLGLPDPFERLPILLAESLSGSQSTIHGDLNLENILVGPGDMLWLIDFAQTRDGHTLQDFAHLYAELIAHILAPQIAAPDQFLALLRSPDGSPHAPLHALLSAVDEMAQRCLFNPSQPREWRISLALTCLGALKYSNLTSHARCLLYLTSAYQLTSV